MTNSLPIQATSFIGRKAEVKQVAERLLNRVVRLLVLTGPGGSGKTRLGLRVAESVAEAFEDGVCYIELYSVTDADLVIGTIAHQLGLQEKGQKPIKNLLEEYLEEKRMLFVLDNFEQVLEAAPTIADLLATNAGLKVLVTSREILHLQGEYDFAVPPLSLPLRNNESDPDLDYVNRLLQCEAAHLFVERAAAARPNFGANPENAPVIAEICHRLDGLPLAIELAAARIRLLPPDDMLARLDDSLSFLTRGAKDRPSRQQTLRSTIDWSYDLLTKDESRIFRWLSVFAGGFTLQAAEAVCNVTHERDVLDNIASLEEKSLITRVESDGEPRFAMLETIRGYADEQLRDSGEAEQATDKHAEFFYALAAQADYELFSVNRTVFLEKLEREHNNFRSVLTRCFNSDNGELGIKLAAVLQHYWAAKPAIESLKLLDKAIGFGSTRSSALARVLCTAGHNRCNLGDMERGMSLIEQGLAMARELPDANGIAQSLSLIGEWTFWSGDSAKATRYFEESIEVAEESGERRVIPYVLKSLGEIAAGNGELDRAQTLIEEALAYFEGDPDVGDVGAHPKKPIDPARRILGSIFMLKGDLERAAALTKQSLAASRYAGNEYTVAVALQQLAIIYVKQGDLRSAKSALIEAVSLFYEMAVKWGVVFGREEVSRCLILSAELAKVEGRYELAARLLGAAENIHEPNDLAIVSWREKFNDISGTVRSELPERQFEGAWNEGNAMSLEKAVSRVLETLEAEVTEKEPIANAGISFPDGLSRREIDEAVLLVEGLTNREIGERLYISERTVANHVQSVLNKTGSGNRAEAAAYVIRNGLTT